MSLFPRIGAFSFSALIVAGCVSSTPSTTPNAQASEEAAPSTQSVWNSEPQDFDGYVVTRIADSIIPDGKCGMVLWTLEDNRPTPVFRYVVGRAADISINGAQIVMAPTRLSGASAYGVSESQRFEGASPVVSGGAAFAVDIDIRFGQNFERGAYLQDGLLKFDAADGWRSVTPVAGIAGCK